MSPPLTNIPAAYRKGTIQPFTKGLGSTELFECLTEVIEVGGNGESNVPHVKAQAEAVVAEAVQQVNRVNEKGLLLRVSFKTLFEYIVVRPASVHLQPHQYKPGWDLACNPFSRTNHTKQL